MSSKYTPHLYISIINARNLIAFDSSGFSNPFCVASLGLNTTRTLVARKTLNPRWNQEFVFYCPSDEEILVLNLYHEVSFGKNSEFLGQVKISINETMKKGIPIDDWYPLGPKTVPSKGDIKCLIDNSIEIEGSLHILIHYVDYQFEFELSEISLWTEHYKRLLGLILGENNSHLTLLGSKVQSGDLDDLTKSICQILPLSQLKKLIFTSISFELNFTQQQSTLFRSNSFCTKIMTSWGKTIAGTALRNALSPILLKIQADPAGYELDPTRMESTEIPEANLKKVLSTCSQILHSLESNAHQFPLDLREVCTFLADQADKKFPGSRYPAIGGFIFLRLICPCIVAPDGYQVLSGQISRAARRAFILCAKILQSLSNGQDYSVKETFLRPVNPWLKENQTSLTALLDDFSINSTPEHSSESLTSDNIDIESLYRDIGSSSSKFKALTHIHQHFHNAAAKLQSTVTPSTSDPMIKLLKLIGFMGSAPQPRREILHDIDQQSIKKQGVIEVYNHSSFMKNDAQESSTTGPILNLAYKSSYQRSIDTEDLDPVLLSIEMVESGLKLCKRHISTQGQSEVQRKQKVNKLKKASSRSKITTISSPIPLSTPLSLSTTSTSDSTTEKEKSYSIFDSKLGKMKTVSSTSNEENHDEFIHKLNQNRSEQNLNITGEEPIDWNALSQDPEFTTLSQLACAMIDIDTSSLEKFSNFLKITFWVNTYNVLVLFAHEAIGPVKSSVATFFTASFQIGQLVFSLDDILHGILRSNQDKNGKPYFKAGDPRCLLATTKCDPRIHFVISNLVKSNPSYRVIPATRQSQVLDSAAADFISQVQVIKTGSKCKLILPRIFKFYQRDFLLYSLDLVEYLEKYFDTDTMIMIGQCDNVVISYFKFHWEFEFRPEFSFDEILHYKPSTNTSSPPESTPFNGKSKIAASFLQGIKIKAGEQKKNRRRSSVAAFMSGSRKSSIISSGLQQSQPVPEYTLKLYGTFFTKLDESSTPSLTVPKR